jgi:hypothetical protein
MTTPLRFAEVVTDPEASAISVAAALTSAGPVAAWPESPLLDAWRPFLGPLAALDSPTTYVGTFRVAVERAASAMAELEGRDRDAAVVVLLQRTAVHAATPAEFEGALRMIHRAAPDALPLGDLLQRVVWVCSLTYRSDGREAMVLGLPATLEVLTVPGGPWLDQDAPPDLDDAVRRLPTHVLEGLVPTIGRLNAADRHVVRAALGLEAPKRRLLRR